MSATNTILHEALQVVEGDRQRDYADPAEMHAHIAALCNAYLNRDGPELTPEDVARMMILLKIARDTRTPKRDNLVDIAGYARCIERIRGS